MTLQFQTITRDEALAFILSGMQAKRAEIDATLRDLRSQQNGPEVVARPSPDPLAKAYQTKAFQRDWAARNDEAADQSKRKVSPATRKRMAAAQRARWAKAKR